MYQAPWTRGPVGLDADHRITRTGCRTVLVMVPTTTAGTRLLDVIPLLEADHRIQVVFTVPEVGDRWQGVEEFVRGWGGLVVPWPQAVQHRWDLVISASHRHIDAVHGRILIMPHGAGAVKSRRYSRKAGTPTQPTTGLDRELLTFRGRVIPAVIALTHDRELSLLRRTCPEALPVAVVAGDLCLDRLMASRPFRQRYRQALGVADHEKLITVSSTWSPDSTFGRHLELYERLLDESAGGPVRIAAVLHPNVWAVHGAWQVRAWLTGAIRKGLMIIPPEHGWGATMIATDHVIGDHGSTTSYAAAIGRPVHLATFPDHNLRRRSVSGALARTASRLEHDQPLLPQLCHQTDDHPSDRLASQISARRGQSAVIMRDTMYRLLELPLPPFPPPTSALPLPQPVPQSGDVAPATRLTASAFPASCRRLAPGAHVLYWPAADDPAPRGDLLVVDHRRADARWTAVADVIIDPHRPEAPDVLTHNLFADGRALLVVFNLDAHRWLICGRDGQRLMVNRPEGDCPVGWTMLLYRYFHAGTPLARIPSDVIAAVGYPTPPDANR